MMATTDSVKALELAAERGRHNASSRAVFIFALASPEGKGSGKLAIWFD